MSIRWSEHVYPNGTKLIQGVAERWGESECRATFEKLLSLVTPEEQDTLFVERVDSDVTAYVSGAIGGDWTVAVQVEVEHLANCLGDERLEAHFVSELAATVETTALAVGLVHRIQIHDSDEDDPVAVFWDGKAIAGAS
jgi:hypothetical protein